MFDFLKTGPDATPLTDKAKIASSYKSKRLSVFLSITLGYALYYVLRQGFAVVTKPLLNEGVFTATEIGAIGSVFFFTYMIGKCLNGFLADSLNIKRFLAMGLFVSAATLVLMGFCSTFYLFAVLWGVSGWFQTFGAAPCIVSLNQWFSNKERGTLYGIWFSAHNIGTALTYVITAYIVVSYGWRWGFWVPGVVCLAAAFLLYFFMYDRPQCYGLPSIALYSGDETCAKPKVSGKEIMAAQLSVIKNPVVWILGLASASCYITRYAFEMWGVLFLTTKGYSLMGASSMIAISQVTGIFGAFTCGWVSDKFFQHKRNVPCLIFGVFFVLSTVGFVYGPKDITWLVYASLALFGYTLYALIAYLGGLMAVDLCSKKATGAVMGVIGLFSYAGASLQQMLNGYLVDAYKYVGVDGKTMYDFTHVTPFWVIAAVVTCVLPLLVWNAKPKEDCD